MPKFAPTHPDAVKAAIGTEALRGTNVPTIVRKLANGTLTGYNRPYVIPLETARYYSKQAKRRNQASRVTELAGGDPSRAIDHLARQLLSEAELGIKEVREAKHRDPEATKRWADVLKGLAPLLRPEPLEGTKAAKRSDKRPSDPLTARLSTADKPSNIIPKRQETDTEEQASNARIDSQTDTDLPTGIGGVAANGVDAGVGGGPLPSVPWT